MKRAVIAFLLIFSGVCNLFAQTNATREEYRVYAQILKGIYHENLKVDETKLSVVILEDTLVPDYDVDETGKMKGLVKDFNRKNRTSSKLKKIFPTKYQYEIIIESEINELWAIGKIELAKIEAENKSRQIKTQGDSGIVWKPFNEKYPSSEGFYQFSRVGFSTDKRFALVLVEGSGTYWHSNRQYILRKVKNNWRIYSSGGGFSVS